MGEVILDFLRHERRVGAVKRRLKDALWAVKGRRLRNPELPTDVCSVLFVCKGNICRSPFAERRMGAKLAPTGPRCSSAGLAVSAEGPPAAARQAASPWGVMLDDHVPRALSASSMEEHDLVVVMEVSHLDEVRARFPQHRHKVALLPLYDPEAQGAWLRFNVPDPYGKDLERFRECYERLDRCLGELARALGSAGGARGREGAEVRGRGSVVNE